MTKIGRFLRGFSLVDFSAVGFLSLLKTFKTQRQKVMFLYKSDFHCKAMRFYGLISEVVVLLIREEMHRSNVQLTKAKKRLPREVYLLARCLMLNRSRRHALIYATKTL